MAAASLTLLGAKALERTLTQLGSDYEKALGQALSIEANEIFAESQDLVPVRESILQGSGVVSKPKKDSRGVYVLVGYGTKYALPVHEMPDSTNWTKPGTGSKYLQRPFEKRLPGWKKRVAMNTRKIALRNLRVR
jgi:hypothetical protein